MLCVHYCYGHRLENRRAKSRRIVKEDISRMETNVQLRVCINSLSPDAMSVYQALSNEHVVRPFRYKVGTLQ